MNLCRCVAMWTCCVRSPNRSNRESSGYRNEAETRVQAGRQVPIHSVLDRYFRELGPHCTITTQLGVKGSLST